MKTRIILAALLLLTVFVAAKKVKKETFSQEKYGIENTGTLLTITFEKGKEHNHPLFAIWLADENGKYIQTLYVSKSIGKGVFEHQSRNKGSWMPGEIQRPATLPYWAHQRGVINEYGTYMPTPRQAVPDAYTGATPQSSFVLQVKTDKLLQGKYKVMLEVNQSWDWNEFWFNDKYPENKEYKTSSQPAVVYCADIDTSKNGVAELKPIGHSHFAGEDGSLTTDISTLTTALKIAKKITVQVNQ